MISWRPLYVSFLRLLYQRQCIQLQTDGAKAAVVIQISRLLQHGDRPDAGYYPPAISQTCRQMLENHRHMLMRYLKPYASLAEDLLENPEAQYGYRLTPADWRRLRVLMALLVPEEVEV